jgi:asparagine synthase (glutamine-hydrolysing)
MCGIAGIFHLRSAADIDPQRLESMNNIQWHRGPDDGGYHYEPGIGLAHRRLSIIDLAGGHQPMFNEDGSVCVVFNGEIYNYRQLAEELKACGHRFKTHSDTETIVHAWEEWGRECVKRFRGMFAFAIWDRRQQSLFLARDRLGIKPLYYALLPDQSLIFGSELKVLKQHPDLPRRMDPHAVEDYFSFGYIPEPKTIYQGVHKLEPGHFLLLKRGDLRPAQQVRYWDIDFSRPLLPPEQLHEELIRRVKEAVDIRLVSEVPLGAFLSGGVDSSAIVAMMSQLQPDPVNSCSIGFDVEGFNESEFAQQVADRYRTNHHLEKVQPDDFSLIDQLADLYDEPFADSSAMPTYRVCELARKHVTVALSGDGGDELFAGYSRYQWHLQENRLRGLFPERLRKPLFSLLGRLYPKMDWAPRLFRAKSTLQRLSFDNVQAYHNEISIFRQDSRNALFSKSFKQQLQGYSSLEVFRRHQANANTTDPLQLIQYLDMKTYLPGDILTKVDRASMAHSLEVRVPLLDHELIEWAMRIDPSTKIRGKEGKYPFKKALEPHLSQDVLYRKKMGFAVPLAHWFRGPLSHKLQALRVSEPLLDSGIFEPSTLDLLIQQHLRGQRDNSASLWALLMFNSFLQKNSV